MSFLDATNSTSKSMFFNYNDIDDFLGWLKDFWKECYPTSSFAEVVDALDENAWINTNKGYFDAGEFIKQWRLERDETGF